MEVSAVENSEVIFETWIYKLRGNGEKKVSHYLSGAWCKKYFVLLREGNKPVIFYYNKKPKNYVVSQKGILALDQHYRVEQKFSFRGKEFVFQLTTATKIVFFAVEKEHIYNLLMFFMRTQIQLKEEFETDCFVVRPERSEDHRRIGAQSTMCLLHVSQWGLTLALQLSKSVLVQWPLRCIRWYECTGRGQFTIETGSHASSGVGRYVFKTRVGQDSSLYDKIDLFINEQAKLQGMVMARSSNASCGLDAYLMNYSGLDSLTEVVADVRFITYLKKIARDIYDHFSEHLGESVVIEGTGTVDTSESPPLSTSDGNQTSNFSRNRRLDASCQLNLTSSRTNDNVVLTSQYIHPGTPVFDMSPIDHVPLYRQSNLNSVTSGGSKADNSLDQVIEAPDNSGSAEVFHPRRSGGSSYKHSDQRNERLVTQLRLRSLSLDDMSEYVGTSERALSLYTNSRPTYQQTGQEKGNLANNAQCRDEAYPYSYAMTPDFGLMKLNKEKSETVVNDNDGYCKPTNTLMKTLSDPNLLKVNDTYQQMIDEDQKIKDAGVKSICHATVGQNSRQVVSSPRYSEENYNIMPQKYSDDASCLSSNSFNDSGTVVILPSTPMETKPMSSSSIKGVNFTPKTRVFTKQKLFGSQPSSFSPSSSGVFSQSAGPPLMLWYPLSEQPGRIQRQLPDPPEGAAANSADAALPFTQTLSNKPASFA